MMIFCDLITIYIAQLAKFVIIGLFFEEYNQKDQPC